MTQSEARTVVVTHGDVDGMVAAAVMIRRERDATCDVQYSNATYVAGKLRQLLGRASPPDRLYVCDIPANPHAYAAASALRNAGVDIYWIDHHPWDSVTPSQMREVCREVVYQEGTRTPAGVLAGQWQGKADPYCEKIGRICYAYEHGTEWERNWFRLLASYVGKCPREVLDRLAWDRPLVEADRQRIAEQEAAEARSSAILSEKPRTEHAASGLAIAVYDTSNMPGVFLGRKVFDFHKIDLCLIRVRPAKWQIACRPGSERSLASLIGHCTLDGVELRAGGRERRLLSIEALSGFARKSDPHESVVRWVCSRL
jgi:hypothetical protein